MCSFVLAQAVRQQNQAHLSLCPRPKAERGLPNLSFLGVLSFSIFPAMNTVTCFHFLVILLFLPFSSLDHCWGRGGKSERD